MLRAAYPVYAASTAVPQPISLRRPTDQLYDTGVLTSVASASSVTGRFSTTAPGWNVVLMVALLMIGLWMNGGLEARLPSDPPPRRALWKMPALACATVVPPPVRSHVSPSRGSGCGGWI